MVNNIVTADFSKSRDTITRYLYKYDYGITLEITGIELPTAFEAHFSNDPSSASVTQIGSENAVMIPDTLLQTGKPVYVWIYLHTGEDDGETVYRANIPVRERPTITDEQPDPVEQSAITQAIAALNSAVDRTDASAQAAAESEANAQASAEAAAGSETNAKSYRDDAYTYSEIAKASAQAAALSEYKASASEVNAQKSADDAEVSADRAEQAAATAGYMWISMNEYGHLVYERTDAVDVDFSLDSTGHLVMGVI